MICFPLGNWHWFLILWKNGTVENSGNWSRREKGSYLGRYCLFFFRKHFIEWTVSFEFSPGPKLLGFPCKWFRALLCVRVFFSMRCAQILKQNCSHDMLQGLLRNFITGHCCSMFQPRLFDHEAGRACMVMVIQQISWERICHSVEYSYGWPVPSQVAQVRNMGIGEHLHCCITFEI